MIKKLKINKLIWSVLIAVMSVGLLAGCSQNSADNQNSVTTSSKSISTSAETMSKTQIVSDKNGQATTESTQATEAIQAATDSQVAVNVPVATETVTEAPTEAPTVAPAPIEVPTEAPAPAPTEAPTVAPAPVVTRPNPAGLSDRVYNILDQTTAGMTPEQIAASGICYVSINKDATSGGTCPYSLYTLTTRTFHNYNGTTVELVGYYGIGSDAYNDALTQQIYAQWGITSMDALTMCVGFRSIVGTYSDKGDVYFVYYARH